MKKYVDQYRQARASLTAAESLETLRGMESFFRGGDQWTQGVYRGSGDSRCLVAAAEHVRVSSIDDAKHWLRQAVAEQTGGAGATLEAFNDTSQSYGEIAAVIARARQLATARLPAPAAPVAPVARYSPVEAVEPVPLLRQPAPRLMRGLAEPQPEKQNRLRAMMEGLSDFMLFLD